MHLSMSLMSGKGFVFFFNLALGRLCLLLLCIWYVVFLKIFVLFDNRIHTYLLFDSFASTFWIQLLLCEKKCFIPQQEKEKRKTPLWMHSNANFPGTPLFHSTARPSPASLQVMTTSKYKSASYSRRHRSWAWQDRGTDDGEGLFQHWPL